MPVSRRCERSRFGFAKVAGGFIGFALCCATRPGTRKPPIQVFRERLGSRCFSKRDICSSNSDDQIDLRATKPFFKLNKYLALIGKRYPAVGAT